MRGRPGSRSGCGTEEDVAPEPNGEERDPRGFRDLDKVCQRSGTLAFVWFWADTSAQTQAGLKFHGSARVVDGG